MWQLFLGLLVLRTSISSLLQSATAFSLKNALVCYYKVRQLFYYKVRQVLLQSATGITKCDIFITKCDSPNGRNTIFMFHFPTDAAAQLLHKLEFNFFTEFTTRLAGQWNANKNSFIYSIFCSIFWQVHFNKMMLWFWLSANFLISRIIHIETTNVACHGDYSVSGMFLKGHTFKTITVDSPTRCQMLCIQDVRCQSYNFVIGKHMCELNNRTKEARPENFVDDPWRFYMKGGFSRGIGIWNLYLYIRFE